MHSMTKACLISFLIISAVAGYCPAYTQTSAGIVVGGEEKGDGNNQPNDERNQPKSPQPADYVIGIDDVLAIDVWNEKDISKSTPVRSDGKISLPLVGELQAAGRTPSALKEEIAYRLKNFITTPTVSVMVEKINSKRFNVLGEVMRPGSYSTAQANTVVDAIALAGGFRNFAKKKEIRILRQAKDGKQMRIHFNYKQFVTGKNPEQNINIEPNDTIIVP